MNGWLDTCLKSSSFWWVFRAWEPVALSRQRRSTCVWEKWEKTWLCSKQKDRLGLRLGQRGWGFGQDQGIKNEQRRLTSRYVLVLPLGQTTTELLSLQSLARWRTESCPGASGRRSEERKGKQAWKLIEETGTADPSCWCFYTTGKIHSHGKPGGFPALGVCLVLVLLLLMIIWNYIDPHMALLFVLSFKKEGQRL